MYELRIWLDGDAWLHREEPEFKNAMQTKAVGDFDKAKALADAVWAADGYAEIYDEMQEWVYTGGDDV